MRRESCEPREIWNKQMLRANYRCAHPAPPRSLRIWEGVCWRGINDGAVALAPATSDRARIGKTFMVIKEIMTCKKSANLGSWPHPEFNSFHFFRPFDVLFPSPPERLGLTESTANAEPFDNNTFHYMYGQTNFDINNNPKVYVLFRVLHMRKRRG